MSDLEIQDFDRKARTLIEIRRRMANGSAPDESLVAAYKRIPSSEVPLIFEMIEYWGMTMDSLESDEPERVANPVQRTWADVVKCGKK